MCKSEIHIITVYCVSFLSTHPLTTSPVSSQARETRETRGPGVAVESDSPSECTGGTGAALIFAAAKRASVLEHGRFQQAC